MPKNNAHPDRLRQLAAELDARYEQVRATGLQLDLTRGKPCTAQLALSDPLDGVLAGNYRDGDGVDTRNYGGITGLREARELCARVLGSAAQDTVMGGNSSLTLMYQVMEFCLNFGFGGQPWKDRGAVKFLCPVPGYDRHFAICEHLGIGMVPVPMTDAGPDMDAVEAQVRDDPAVAGIWCVPRFSNPSGVVYSGEVVDRLARLGKVAAPGFLIMWDNAYAVHTLYDDAPALANINPLLQQYGTDDSVIQFGSTSKITFAGAGMAFFATSAANVSAFTSHLGFSTIGPDKVNQLRHVRFLGDSEGLENHMRRHAAIIRPRFEMVLRLLEEELSDTGMGSWTSPKGGYFVLFNSRPGLAATIVKMAADIGVKLTPAGATWPYGKDPNNREVRLAPTYPDIEEVEQAMRAFILCVKLASVRQELAAL